MEEEISANADTEGVRARQALIVRLRIEPIVDIGRWTRDELYDRSGLVPVPGATPRSE